MLTKTLQFTWYGDRDGTGAVAQGNLLRQRDGPNAGAAPLPSLRFDAGRAHVLTSFYIARFFAPIVAIERSNSFFRSTVLSRSRCARTIG